MLNIFETIQLNLINKEGDIQYMSNTIKTYDTCKENNYGASNMYVSN